VLGVSGGPSRIPCTHFRLAIFKSRGRSAIRTIAVLTYVVSVCARCRCRTQYKYPGKRSEKLEDGTEVGVAGEVIELNRVSSSTQVRARLLCLLASWFTWVSSRGFTHTASREITRAVMQGRSCEFHSLMHAPSHSFTHMLHHSLALMYSRLSILFIVSSRVCSVQRIFSFERSKDKEGHSHTHTHTHTHTQPIFSFEWSKDKEGLCVTTAADQTLRVMIVTRLGLQ
jgi:hypothetical protein